MRPATRQGRRKAQGADRLQALLSEPLSVLKEGNPGTMPPKPVRSEGLPSPEGIYAINDRKE